MAPAPEENVVAPSVAPEQAAVPAELPVFEPVVPLPAEAPAPVADADAPARNDSPAPAADIPAVADDPAPLAPLLPTDRRLPLRFVWQTDAENRLTVGSQELAALVGPSVAAAFGQPWSDIAGTLALDPDGRLARAFASHDTFSGIEISWPVEGLAARLASELSGLPVFDRERVFRGYRGFQDLSRRGAALRDRRGPNAPPPPAPEPTVAEDVAPPAPSEGQNAPGRQAPKAPRRLRPARPQFTVVPPVKNVVPFRAAPGADKRPTLSAVERNAFQEIAKKLGAEPPVAEPRTEPETPGPETGEVPAEPTGATMESEASGPAAAPGSETEPATPETAKPRRRPLGIPSAYAAGAITATVAAAVPGERAVLDRLPVAVLVYRGDKLIYANRALLEWTGYEDVEAIAAAGGLERLFAEPGVVQFGEPGGSGGALAITTRRGQALSV